LQFISRVRIVQGELSTRYWLIFFLGMQPVTALGCPEPFQMKGGPIQSFEPAFRRRRGSWGILSGGFHQYSRFMSWYRLSREPDDFRVTGVGLNCCLRVENRCCHYSLRGDFYYAVPSNYRYARETLGGWRFRGRPVDGFVALPQCYGSVASSAGNPVSTHQARHPFPCLPGRFTRDQNGVRHSSHLGF